VHDRRVSSAMDMKCVAAVESVGAPGECPRMGVGGFVAGVGQAVVERLVDELAEAAEAAGVRDDLRVMATVGVCGPIVAVAEKFSSTRAVRPGER
jgi:hypothetical protein